MAAADEQLILAGGTLYADGTALGTVQAVALEHVGFQDPILAEEWGGETWDLIHLREEVVCTAVLADWDADAVAAYFPNVLGSVTVVPGSTTYGSLASGNAVKLTYTPLATHGGFTLYEAVPLLGQTRIPFNAQEPMLVEVSWLALRNSSDNAARVEPTQTPLSIFGNVLAWYDASDSSTITSDDDGISQWDDKSGNGNHLVQATDSKKPNVSSASVNGLDSVLFDDANQETMRASGLDDLSAPFYAFVVMKPDSTASIQYPAIIGDGAFGSYTVLQGGGGAEDIAWGSPGDTARLPGAYEANVVKLFEGHEVSSTSRYVYANAVTGAEDTGTRTYTGVDTIEVGGASNGTGGCSGRICEVVILDATPTATQLSSLRTYFNRWGLSL